MTELAKRRRAIIAGGALKDRTILYELESQVSHGSVATFYSSTPLLDRDRDWTALVDIQLSFRDACVFFASVVAVPTTASNTTIESLVRNNGGVGVGQNNNAGNSAIYTIGSRQPIPDWSWSAGSGRIKCCITHQRGLNQFRMFFKYANNQVFTTNITATSYPKSADSAPGCRFKGTLYTFTIYSTVLSNEECLEFVTQ